MIETGRSQLFGAQYAVGSSSCPGFPGKLIEGVFPPQKRRLPRAVCLNRAHKPVSALRDAERRRQQPVRGHREALRGLGRQGPPHGLSAWCRKVKTFETALGLTKLQAGLHSPGLLPPRLDLLPRMAAAAVARHQRPSPNSN